MKRLKILLIISLIYLNVYPCDIYSSLEFDEKGISTVQLDVQYGCLIMDFLHAGPSEIGKEIRTVIKEKPNTTLAFDYMGQSYVISISSSIPVQLYNSLEEGTNIRITIRFYQKFIIEDLTKRTVPYGLITEIKLISDE